ncbi:hypothetical protein EDB86DRAFT_2835704 [Lactarius hatsudake]|nr:hypothetical protein EDB86DRAFT_2835704 [Lactarius hatsudake]
MFEKKLCGVDLLIRSTMQWSSCRCLFTSADRLLTPHNQKFEAQLEVVNDRLSGSAAPTRMHPARSTTRYKQSERTEATARRPIQTYLRSQLYSNAESRVNFVGTQNCKQTTHQSDAIFFRYDICRVVGRSCDSAICEFPVNGLPGTRRLPTTTPTTHTLPSNINTMLLQVLLYLIQATWGRVEREIVCPAEAWLRRRGMSGEIVIHARIIVFAQGRQNPFQPLARQWCFIFPRGQVVPVPQRETV